MIPRQIDIKIAFINAISPDSKRGRVISTRDFVAELGRLNHYWSLRQANELIAYYQTCLRDYTDHEGEDKNYFLTNMGYVR